jgi:hypothetical protein
MNVPVPASRSQEPTGYGGSMLSVPIALPLASLPSALRRDRSLGTSAIQGLAHGGPHPEAERARYDAFGRTTDCGPLGTRARCDRASRG